MAVSGEDYFVDGEGVTHIRLFGRVPLVKGSGPDISRSALGRMVAKSVLIPSALLPQSGAVWHGGDENHVRVEMKAAGEAPTLTVGVAEDGRLREAMLERWGNQADNGEYTHTPFGINVDEESTLGGYTIPSQLRAGWWYGTDRYAEFSGHESKTPHFGEQEAVEPRLSSWLISGTSPKRTSRPLQLRPSSSNSC